MTISRGFVNTDYYHLWTDTLHARALAHQVRNRWDRGAYVRWTVINAWAVLEMVFREALDDEKIGNRFKEDVNRALSDKGLESLNWGSGIWQKVLDIKKLRKTYVHTKINQIDLFPDTGVADSAILIVREATKAIYKHINMTKPAWIEDDQDRGWDNGGKGSHITMTMDGAKEDDPDVIKVAYVFEGREYVSNVYPQEDTNYEPIVNNLIRNIRIPISSVRVYKGNQLINELVLNMRGSELPE